MIDSIDKPIEGAKKGGFHGLMKGVFQGAKSLMLKPTIGIVDGIKNATEGFTKHVVTPSERRATRMRDPRVFYGQERIFQEYNGLDARVQAMLLRKNREKYSLQTNVVSHYFKSTTKGESNQPITMNLCLWITAERIFLIDLRAENIVWKIKTNKIFTFTVDNNGIQIYLNSKKLKPNEEVP